MDTTKRILWSSLSVVSLLVFWFVAGIAIPEVIPGLPETFESLLTILTTPGPYDQMFYYHIWHTSVMIFGSLILAIALGTVIGVALGLSEPLENSVSSYIYAWIAVPSLVVVFVAASMFGFNAQSGFVAVPIVVTPFVALNMWEGARTLDPQLSEMGEFFGATRYHRFKSVILPQLIPFLFASIRSALSIGWKITLLVEAFLLTRGVGSMFNRAFGNYDLASMMAWLVIFTVLLIVVEYGLLAPVHSKVTEWRPDTGTVRAAE